MTAAPLLPMESVLVTGAAGFVGANLVRRLLRLGHRVHALVRSSSDLWRLQGLGGDLTLHYADLAELSGLLAAVERARPTVVFHVATEGGHYGDRVSRIRALYSGVLGTAHLLEALREAPVRSLVYAASSLEYGPSEVRQRETELPAPICYRGAVKACGTLLCQQYARETQVPVACLRLYAVYGPWEQPRRLVPTAIRAAVHRRPLSLTAPGLVHDWVFVDDVVDACLVAADAASPGEVFNIASGVQTANEAIVSVIERVAGRPIRVSEDVYPAKTLDRRYWQADVTRAREVLGWRPRHSLEESMRRTLDWFATDAPAWYRDFSGSTAGAGAA